MAKLISKLQSADNNGECITPESSNAPSESDSPQNTKVVFSETVIVETSEDDSDDSDDDVADAGDGAVVVDKISIVIADISNNAL